MMKYTEETPLRVFTTFSGYDSQCLALRKAGIPFDLVGWSEIEKRAIMAHDALFPEYKDRNYGDICKIDWTQVPDFDFFTYSSPCFIAGTKVLTDKGEKEIQNIEIGDFVLTHNKSFKRVTEVFKSEYTLNLLEIELEGNTSKVICTLNHPFYVFRDGEYKWIEALNLKLSDFIANQSGIRRFAPLVINGELCEKKIGEHICTKVKSVVVVPNDFCIVYNMEVEDDHSYTANRMFVHNCQSFSIAGQRLGGEEGSGTKSSLLWECKKAIEIKKPKYLMLENVKMLVSKNFMPTFMKWVDFLDSLGYTSYWKVLCGLEYGVPQDRRRVYMVSIMNPEREFEFPKPIGVKTSVEDYMLTKEELGEELYEKLCVKKEIVDNYVHYNKHFLKFAVEQK